MRELKVGLILSALLLGFFFVYQPVADFVRSVPYRFSKQGEIMQVVGPDIEKRFDWAVPQGSYGDLNGPVVFYSSFYDEQTHVYFYRIRNNSDEEFYARSRIFLLFLGEAGVRVSSRKELYIKVQDPNPLVERNEKLYLSYNRYSPSLSRGLGMQLVMPREKPQHHLVWRSY